MKLSVIIMILILTVGMAEKFMLVYQGQKQEGKFLELVAKKIEAELGSYDEFDEDTQEDAIEMAEPYLSLFRSDPKRWLDYATKNGIDSIEAIINGKVLKKAKKEIINDLKKAKKAVTTETKSVNGVKESQSTKDMSTKDSLLVALKKLKKG